ncbi:endonuclease V [Actinoplanes sp. URMC 104]|uniref:endonuclease V n=1 Tax=Actinoplanes sp. URMC 104 TaxID=3423409 RepID=UPI003F1B2C86
MTALSAVTGPPLSVPLLRAAIDRRSTPPALLETGFVSAGHRIGTDDGARLAVRLSGRCRIPEPTRQADIVSRRILAMTPEG